MFSNALKFCVLCGLASLCSRLPAQLPSVQVHDVRRVFHNGEHNAFTDLTRFRDRFYLTFRSCPDGHMVHPTSSIVVLASDDLKDWQQVHRFQVPQRDTRDPHFLVFREQLFVLTGTWFCGDHSPSAEEYDLNQHLGFAVFTRDGTSWSAPSMLEGTYGHYIWRAAALGDQAYLCGRRKHRFDARHRNDGPIVESAMLKSDDGLVWSTHSLFQAQDGDETAFAFGSNGSLLGVSRRGRGNAELLQSEPPYETWQRSDLGCYIGGPLLVDWAGRWVVAGRRFNQGASPTTVFYWLHDRELVPFAELPSAGDNSYPGMVVIDARRAVVSWYSSHERDAAGDSITAIYMAEFVLDAKKTEQDVQEIEQNVQDTQLDSLCQFPEKR